MADFPNNLQLQGAIDSSKAHPQIECEKSEVSHIISQRDNNYTNNESGECTQQQADSVSSSQQVSSNQSNAESADPPATRHQLINHSSPNQHITPRSKTSHRRRQDRSPSTSSERHRQSRKRRRKKYLCCRCRRSFTPSSSSSDRESCSPQRHHSQERYRSVKRDRSQERYHSPKRDRSYSCDRHSSRQRRRRYSSRSTSPDDYRRRSKKSKKLRRRRRRYHRSSSSSSLSQSPPPKHRTKSNHHKRSRRNSSQTVSPEKAPKLPKPSVESPNQTSKPSVESPNQTSRTSKECSDNQPPLPELSVETLNQTVKTSPDSRMPNDLPTSWERSLSPTSSYTEPKNPARIRGPRMQDPHQFIKFCKNVEKVKSQGYTLTAALKHFGKTIRVMTRFRGLYYLYTIDEEKYKQLVHEWYEGGRRNLEGLAKQCLAELTSDQIAAHKSEGRLFY